MNSSRKDMISEFNNNLELKLRNLMYTSVSKGSETINKYKDELPGEIDDSSSTEGSSIHNSKNHLNSDLRRPPSPTYKKTGKVLTSLHKLTLFQHQDEIMRFFYRSNVTQSPFTDSCLTTLIPFQFIGGGNKRPSSSPESCESKKKVGNNSGTKGKRQIISCGPFLSCPGRHARGPDYQIFPWFMKPSERSILCSSPAQTTYHSFNERPNSTPSSRPNSVHNVPSDFKCRNCPKTPISIGSDPDAWYENYKATVTYGKIDKTHKKKLQERYQAFLDIEDAESVTKTDVGNKRYQNPGRRGETFMEAPFALPFQSPRNKNEASESGATKILYGPAAIASVSGYKYKRSAVPPVHAKPKKFNILMPMKPSLDEPQKNNSVVIIPFPSDNVRYYDDDTDLEIIEHLANTPLTFGPDPNGYEPLANTAVGSFSTVISSHDPQTIIYEYTVGTRVGPKGDDSPRVKKIISAESGKRRKKVISTTVTMNHKKKQTSSDQKNTLTPGGKRLTETKTIPANVKRNSKLDGAVRPKSVRVSPRLQKSVLSSPRKMKGVISKNKRFSQEISTVSLPTPSSKYKPNALISSH